MREVRIIDCDVVTLPALRIPVTPFRCPEPNRSALVERYGEVAVAALEQRETEWHDRMLNGDPDAVEPVGVLHADLCACGDHPSACFGLCGTGGRES